MAGDKKRLIVAITGATGAIFGVRLLETLRETDIETHLVISKWAQQTIEHETDWRIEDVRALADASYSPGDMGAAISSGSFLTEGMIITPCSMHSVSAIANGTGSHLVHRAADVILKERRKLVIVARETPLNDIHLENLLKLSRMGVSILPPVPAFYNHPRSVDDIVDHIVMRSLDQFHIAHDLGRRWDGNMKTGTSHIKPVT